MGLLSIFGFGTNAANGKSGEELDAERARLDEQRRQRERQRALDLEEQGRADEAERVRAAALEYEQQQRDNYQREAEALEETPSDAFSDELDKRATALGNAGDRVIGRTLSTVFSAVPWFVWIALGLFAAWKLGLLKFKRSSA